MKANQQRRLYFPVFEPYYLEIKARSKLRNSLLSKRDFQEQVFASKSISLPFKFTTVLAIPHVLPGK
jgi:hypothetical protein